MWDKREEEHNNNYNSHNEILVKILSTDNIVLNFKKVATSSDKTATTMTNEWIEWTGENRIRTPTIFRGNNTCSSSFLNNNQHNYKFNPSQTSITTTPNMGLKSPTTSPSQQPQQQQPQQLHHSLFKSLYQHKSRGNLTTSWDPSQISSSH